MQSKGRKNAREWPFGQISVLRQLSEIKTIVEKTIGHMPKDNILLVALIATYVESLHICCVSMA